MAQKFVLRGNALTAYKHSGSGKTPIVYDLSGGGAPAVVSDAGAIGGQAISYDGGGITKGHIFPGFDNSSKTGIISVLTRIAPTYSGSPSSNSAIISLMSSKFTSVVASLFEINHLTNGNLVFSLLSPSGGASQNNAVLGAWSPTSGTYYDIVVTWTGTTAANGIKVYIDGTLFAQLTAGVTWAAGSLHTNINIGVAQNSVILGLYKLNEFIVWDSVIDPTSGGLNLNGNARSSFVTVTGTLDPTNSTDPGIANVRLSTGYIINGSSLTGTAAIPAAANVRSGTATDATTGSLAVPSASNVRSGVSVDATTGTLTVPTLANTKTGVAGDGGTGTYDGSDRHTDPGIANVRLGTAYKDNSTSNNRTGTAAIPSAADVRLGTAIDATTGTAAIPSAADVRLGTAVDATTGTLVVVVNTLTAATLTGQAAPPAAGTVLEITQGDSISFSMLAKNGASATAFNLTGATFTSYLKGASGSTLSFGNSQHAADADQVTNTGKFTLSLSAVDTALLNIGEAMEVITKVTQGSSVIHFHGLGLLTVLSPDPDFE